MTAISDLRVLVAEDNAMNWAVMNGTLAKWGPKVDHAENGQEAVDAATSHRYDVIFMDIDMPVMDGYEATQTIADLLGEERPRIYAVTANMLAEDEAKSRGIPFDGYMTKPIEPQQLHAWLETVTHGTDAPSSDMAGEATDDAPAAALDQNVLDGMVDQIGPEVAKSMLEEFIHSAPVIGANLSAALRKADRDDAAKTAHQLKSMAGYIGAKELQTTCMAIDEPDFDELDDAKAEEVEGLVDAALGAAKDLVASGWPEA